MKTKIIVISARWYAITAAAEYLSRAFEQLKDVRVVKVGPTHGNLMPYKTNGLFVPDSYSVIPDIVLPDTFMEVPVKYVENKLMEIGITGVDIWLDVHAGFRLSGKPERLGGIRTLFMTDPHTHLGKHYTDVQNEYDMMFNPQLAYWLEIPDTKQKYLPYAADEWYRYDRLDKVYDVSLVGNLYKERVAYFDEIKRRNRRTYFDVGAGKWDAGKIYNQSIVGFNWSSMNDLVCRVFEVGYSDSVLVTNRVPALAEHFKEGIHFFGFDGFSSAVEVSEFVLKTPEVWEKTKTAMQLEIKTKHRWKHRAIQIFEYLDISYE